MYSYPQYQIPVQQVYAPQPMEPMSVILEPGESGGGLYLGDIVSTMSTHLLIKENIGAILSVAIDASKSYIS